MYIEFPWHELSAFGNDWWKGCSFGKLGILLRKYSCLFVRTVLRYEQKTVQITVG